MKNKYLHALTAVLVSSVWLYFQYIKPILENASLMDLDSTTKATLAVISLTHLCIGWTVGINVKSVFQDAKSWFSTRKQ